MLKIIIAIITTIICILFQGIVVVYGALGLHTILDITAVSISMTPFIILGFSALIANTVIAVMGNHFFAVKFCCIPGAKYLKAPLIGGVIFVLMLYFTVGVIFFLKFWCEDLLRMPSLVSLIVMLLFFSIAVPYILGIHFLVRNSRKTLIH